MSARFAGCNCRQITMNSRTKGKVGELELSAVLKGHGYETRRGQQYSGGSDSPDVVGLPGVHIECKRTERGSLHDWLDQAIRDAGVSGAIPVVMHRRNKPRNNVVTCRGEWVAILRLDDLLNLYKRAETY